MKRDLDFCNLIFSKEDKFINKEMNLLKKAYKINEDFFNNITIPKFDIKLVYSRKELDKEWGSKNQDFVSAFAKDDNIVILAYSIFDKESIWKKKHFFQALIHEINHLFYQEYRDDSYDPLWLSEGLATILQCIYEKKTSKHKIKITYESLNQIFEDINQESYKVFTMFTNFLLKSKGKEKLFLFIEELKNGFNKEESFQKVYNNDFNGLIQDANRYYKII